MRGRAHHRDCHFAGEVLHGMKKDANSAGQPPRRGDPQMPISRANRLVAKVSRLYAQAAPEDQLALRVWMRDIILGRKVGSANTVRARRVEKRMVEACERRILEFPLGMDARQVPDELKREGWYAWASDYESVILRIKRVRAKAGPENIGSRFQTLHKPRVVRKRTACLRESTTSFPSLRTKIRPPSLSSCGFFT